MRIAVALGVVSLVGCASDPTLSESSSTIVIDNKLAANKLAANKLAANKLAASDLQSIDQNELLESSDGREVLGFIVSCAIDADKSLIASSLDGTEYEFFGEVGLANHWLHSPVDESGAAWVSACMFARVNASNVPLPISIRGSHPALATDEAERAGWSLQEGAFYGDFFTDDELDWNACRGDDQAAGETGGLVERDCAEPCTPGEILDGGVVCEAGMTRCGFNYAGDCGEISEHHACRDFDEKGAFYKRCLDEPGYKNKPNGNSVYKPSSGASSYKHVITVYVQP
jgi:hypothetical protein